METVEVENGDTVIVKNENTTIGYATFDSKKRELTYCSLTQLSDEKVMANC